jgi:circadian clock protein KaiB
MTSPHNSTSRRFEDALAARDETWYELTLVIIGASQLSARAIANARQFCETFLAGRYHLAIVDLHEEPASVVGSQVLAAPTLVKNYPLPVQKFVGDLSRTEMVLMAFGLEPAVVDAAVEC